MKPIQNQNGFYNSSTIENQCAICYNQWPWQYNSMFIELTWTPCPTGRGSTPLQDRATVGPGDQDRRARNCSKNGYKTLQNSCDVGSFVRNFSLLSWYEIRLSLFHLHPDMNLLLYEFLAMKHSPLTGLWSRTWSKLLTRSMSLLCFVIGAMKHNSNFLPLKFTCENGRSIDFFLGLRFQVSTRAKSPGVSCCEWMDFCRSFNWKGQQQHKFG